MIALIDYDMGNLFSVTRAFEFCGEKPVIVSRPEELRKFDAAVLPGVGNFGDGMAHLEKYGFIAELLDFAASGRPLLGICMGMQMLLDSSEEAPGVPGLGLIGGRVRRFPDGSNEKVPQIGWNAMRFSGKIPPLFSGMPDGGWFYFVHSYYAEVDSAADVIGVTDYIVPGYASAVGRGNIFGVQFHPEKSQRRGLDIIANFIGMANAQK